MHDEQNDPAEPLLVVPHEYEQCHAPHLFPLNSPHCRECNRQKDDPIHSIAGEAKAAA